MLTEAQTPQWARIMYAEGATVEAVTKAYDEYYKHHEFEKNKYTQDYKRFIRGKSREAFDLSNLQQLRAQQSSYEAKSVSYRNGSASWDAIGPFDIDLSSAAVGSTPGLAHVYTVEKDEFLVAGTATAGVWKSQDNGHSWIPLTNDLLVTEVKAVEIVGNTIYFGGNGYIYQSFDGGQSWYKTGNSTFQSKYHQTLDIVSSGSLLYAATNHGLYISDDSGSDWNQVLSGNFQEIEVHPTDPDVVYAIAQEGNGTSFYRSENAGTSFTRITNGYPEVTSGQEQLRTEIAVSPAMPDRVVALATGVANGGSGLYGIYVSDDAGLSWTFKCCGIGPGGAASSTNKNIMAWQASGEVSGGQYYYDVALAVSSTNADEIYAGGINIWKSVDGGSSFYNHADYIFSKAGDQYVHADIQDIRIYGNEIWVASDGGIFMSNDNGNTFLKRMKGIVATDFRGFGAGAKAGEVLIGGTYHNGTLVKENNTYDGWLSIYSGDNTHGQVNPQNNRITYSDIGMVTLPGSASSTPTIKSLTIKPNASYKTGESSEYAFHPTNGNTFFLGSGGSIYKTEDNGSNFTLLRNFGSGKVTRIEVAPSNPGYIYAVYLPDYSSHKKLFKTTDGGQNWEDVSPAASVFQNDKLWIAWDIAVSASDENELWLARTPQTSSNALINGQQVFKTTDGGATWQNYSDSGLNGEMITNIVHQHGTLGGVYVGTRRSVFYKSESTGQWVEFRTGLPAITYSTGLVILYQEDKIINATHRGVYASDLYEKVVKNVAFQVNQTEALCENDAFFFSNNSTGFGDHVSFKWTFENGTPSISYEENPVVKFKGLGGHSVTLEITENESKSSHTETNFVSVLDVCEVESLPGSAVKTSSGNFLIIPPLGIETNEITFSTWVKRTGITKNNAGLITMQRFSNNTGLSILSTGEVKFMWNKVGQGIETGLFIPKDKWTHIAMSVSPNKISVYVDGIERRFEGSFAAVNFDKEVLLGKDANSISYYFNGCFDETAIFGRYLTTAEIREQMNLVKSEGNHPDLLHYFQFNKQGDKISDIVGSRHASFFSNPVFEASMAPIGAGTSEVKKIENFGMHHFNLVDVDLNIESGISCNSDLGIYKIQRNVSGATSTHSSDYLYIVNHFSEENFAINGTMTISSAFESLEAAEVRKDSFKLHQVGFDADPDWDNNTRAYAMDYDPENSNQVVFEVDEAQDMEGKFLVSYNESQAALAISDIYFILAALKPGEVDVQWFLHPEDHFIRTELQRSGDGIRFETIKAIDNKRGQLAFHYLDKNPLSGMNYYRVKMTYADGEQDYSKIDRIRVNGLAEDQFVYPNPANSDVIHLRDLKLNGAKAMIFDMTGKKVLERSNIENGRLDIAGLHSGMFLVVVEETTARRQQLFIRN